MILCRNTFDNLASNDPWALYWIIATVQMPAYQVMDAIESLTFKSNNKDKELQEAIKQLVTYMLDYPDACVQEACLNGIYYFDDIVGMLGAMEKYIENCKYHFLIPVAKDILEEINYQIRYITEQAELEE